MRIADGGGNGVAVRRDYKLQVKELVQLNGQRCRFTIDNMGQLQAFVAADNTTWKFSYLGNTGLVESKETSDGVTLRYQYDNNGRLSSVTHPTGRSSSFHTSVNQSGAVIFLHPLGGYRPPSKEATPPQTAPYTGFM